MARILYPIVQQPVPRAPFAETVTESRWHQPLSTPTYRPFAFAAAILSGAVVPPIAPFPETVTESRWHQPLSEPVRTKPALPTATAQNPLSYSESAQFPETVTESRWHAPLSEPVRFKPSLLPGSQQTSAFVYAPAPTEVVYLDKWWREASIPVRYAPSLATAIQPSQAYTEAAPFAETTYVSKWLSALSEPSRLKSSAVALIAAGQTRVFGADSAASAGTPTLIQHLASSCNPVGLGISGDNFAFTLPNSVGAGNCLVLAISYPHGNTATVTDNNGNSWPGSPAVTADAGSGGYVAAIFVLPNANSGVTKITVSFGASVIPFQYTVSEFTNVATASPVSGTTSNAGQTGSASLTSGSFTPSNNDANGGNLIYNYYAISAAAASNPSSWVAGGSFALLDADIAWTNNQGFPHASQYYVQATSASISPGITATSDTSDHFNAVAVALKASSAGTAAPAGIHVNKIIGQTIVGGSPSTIAYQVPTTGNLLVMGSANGNAATNVTSVTDSDGGSWTKIEPAADEPQIWYSANRTPNTALTVTFHVSGSTPTMTVFCYDISGAAASPYDNSAGLGSTDVTGTTSLNNAPSITPNTQPGLTIAILGDGNGPVTGFNTGAPSGAFFEAVSYTGEIDTDLINNADGYAHLYYSSLSQQNWNWTFTSRPSNSVAGTAVTFKAAPVTPAPPLAWWRELSSPVRFAAALAVSAQPYLSYAEAAPFQETIRPDKWFSALSEPVRFKPALLTGLNPNLAYTEAAPFAETVSLDRWLYPLSEPVRFKPALQTASQSVLAYAEAQPFPESVSIDRWLQGLSVPVRFAPRLLEASQQSLAFVKAASFPESVTVDRWEIPLSEPTRFKPAPLTASQSAAGFVYNSPSTETILLDKWWRELSIPVQFRAALGTGSQSFYTSGTFLSIMRSSWAIAGSPIASPPITQYSPSTPETILADKWFRELSLPVRFAPALGTGSQQAFAFVKAALFPESVSIDRWLIPLGEPVRFRPALSTAAAQNPLSLTEAAPFAETVSVNRWLLPFSEPVRFKPSLLTGSQQASPWGAFTPPPEIILLDKWWRETSIPVRYPASLLTAIQRALALTQAAPFAETVSVSRWLQGLSLPRVLTKTGLSTAAQPFAAYTEAAPFRESVSIDRWLMPLSEFIRFAPGLSSANQQALFAVWNIYVSSGFNPAILLAGI